MPCIPLTGMVSRSDPSAGLTAYTSDVYQQERRSLCPSKAIPVPTEQDGTAALICRKVVPSAARAGGAPVRDKMGSTIRTIKANRRSRRFGPQANDSLFINGHPL